MRIGAYSLISAEADDGTMPKCAVLDTNVVIDMEHFYFNQTSEEERQSLKDLLLYLDKNRIDPCIGFALLESCHQWRSGFDENNFQRKRYVAETMLQWDKVMIENNFPIITLLLIAIKMSRPAISDADRSIGIRV